MERFSLSQVRESGPGAPILVLSFSCGTWATRPQPIVPAVFRTNRRISGRNPFIFKFRTYRRLSDRNSKKLSR
jgi:hypothetical protein